MIRLALATTAFTGLASLAAPAAAQDADNAYVQVHGGVFLQTGDELSFDRVDGGDVAVLDIDPDAGFAVGALVGYEIALGLSVEVEATLRSNDVSLDDAGGLVDTDLGDEETLAIMLNGAYTFQVPFLADPYVGLGAGYVKPQGDVDAFEGAFAYQAKAGLLWPVGAGRVLTEVSWLGTDGLEAEDGLDAELDYGGVAFNVGYRFSF